MAVYAHSGTVGDRSDWQLLGDHLAAVEREARQRGEILGLGDAAAIAGRFHDLGKYNPEFDRILCGENIHVDHSTAGGRALVDAAPAALKAIAEALAYPILGHHAGLPDRDGPDQTNLVSRLSKPAAELDSGWRNHLPVDFSLLGQQLRSRCRRDPEKAGFDLSVAVRMVFSCLVDADYRDTEAFYDTIEGHSRDREWPELQACLPEFGQRFDAYMAGLDQSTELNRLRSAIMAHARDKAGLAPGLFTLSVPTGGGKTLASLGFALDHSARHGLRRIIYAIPYTSIIDQTAGLFRRVLGEASVLEHHSAIETDRPAKGGRDKLRMAMEDWAAPVIVTTNVQLFESLFAARPSRARKLHNIAGSVIVLDEAQCLPRELLLPTLAMIDVLARHYGCSIVLCTATQPVFDSRQLKTGGLALDPSRELAPDLQGLSRQLRRVRIRHGGEMGDAALVEALAGVAQGFVIVSSRKHALALFQAARAAGLDGVMHLSTRQYPVHRRAIIADIRKRLANGLPCRLIATSLIEAGVDLDFPCGWRAEAGLDSVIQAAGRVNREGRRTIDASTLTVFSDPDNPPPKEVAKLAEAMRATADRFDDLLDPDAIRDWFEEVYWRSAPKTLGAGMAEQMILGRSETNFPFRKMAAEYRMIDSTMVPVIIVRDAEAHEWVAKLGQDWEGPGPIARGLQPYLVQIPASAREILRQNGKGDFVARELRGDQFFVLSDSSLYQDEFGLWWEAAEYLNADQSLI